MTQLYAQPYDISACGFYFDSPEEYEAKAANNFNDFGRVVEEYEIQFIDGDGIDAELFQVLSVNQANFARFLDVCDEWDEGDKIKVIIAVGEAGDTFSLGRDDPARLEVDLYRCDSFRALAMEFVEDGLFGEIPAAIQNYVDYDAIGRDLSADYGQAVIAGSTYMFRCG